MFFTSEADVPEVGRLKDTFLINLLNKRSFNIAPESPRNTMVFKTSEV